MSSKVLALLSTLSLLCVVKKGGPRSARQYRDLARWRFPVEEVDEEGRGIFTQVVYLDVDTLWIDSMGNVEQEFTKMREKDALFGMSIETTALNGNGSWYKGGEVHESVGQPLIRLSGYTVACLRGRCDASMRALHRVP